MYAVAQLIQQINKLRAYGIIDKPWFNALWFQLTWFSCVIGRESWLGASFALIGLHFLLASAPRKELYNLTPIIAVGVAVDALLSAVGVFDFGSTLIPMWLIVLWIAFATTITRAFAFFEQRPLMAAGVGALGVPFNYAIGAKLGAVNLPLEPMFTAVVLICVWGLLFPSLFRIAAHRKSGAC